MLRHSEELSPPRFGGSSFGSPKQSRRVSATPRSRSVDDAPPLTSLYDSTQKPSSNLPLPSVAPPDPSSSVIVFGFPPALTSHVLSFFQKFGQVTSYSSNLAAGNNWLKIIYTDSHSAQRAVAANGSKIGGSYMVGCVPSSENTENADLMDLDAPQSYLPRTVSMPALQSSSSAPVKRIAVLGGEGIFKSEAKKESSWWPSKDTPSQVPQGNSFFSRIGKLVVDGLFGF